MFFNKRKRYNSQVAELLPELGTSIDDAGLFKALDALDFAFTNNLSTYEAAMFIANSVYGTLVKISPDRAAKIMASIEKTQKHWLAQNKISPRLIEWFQKQQAEYAAASASGEPEYAWVATEDLPDGEDDESTSSTPPISEAMPNFRNAQIYCALKTSRYTFLFTEKPKSLAESMSGRRGVVSFNFALLVIDNFEGGGAFYITSESCIGGSKFLCMFDELGRHINLRSADDIKTKEQFSPVALDIACQRFNISPKELKTVDEA